MLRRPISILTRRITGTSYRSNGASLSGKVRAPHGVTHENVYQTAATSIKSGKSHPPESIHIDGCTFSYSRKRLPSVQFVLIDLWLRHGAQLPS